MVQNAVSNQIESNKTNYFIVRLKVDQRAGQVSLPHLGITKTEEIELKQILSVTYIRSSCFIWVVCSDLDFTISGDRTFL